MTRYVKRPQSEPTDQDWLAALILLGPFAHAVSWRHTHVVHISTVIPRRQSCTV
jgi:hypothetical protein